jgi:hypothetical protein
LLLGLGDRPSAASAESARPILTPPEALERKEEAMLVIRFKVKCQPGKTTDQALAAFKDVIAPSRAIDGSSASTSLAT